MMKNAAHAPQIVCLLVMAVVLWSLASTATAVKSEKAIPISATESNWVIFREISSEIDGDTILLSGTFLMKAERMYGHFEAVSYDEKGNALNRAKTDDLPYRRDHGPTLKKFALMLKQPPDPPAKIVISFLETKKKEGY